MYNEINVLMNTDIYQPFNLYNFINLVLNCQFVMTTLSKNIHIKKATPHEITNNKNTNCVSKAEK